MVIHSRRAVVAVALLATLSAPLFAAKISDIAKTKHNLSSSGPGTVKATTETQICVFCHTPHKANAAAMVPLWNRELSGETYTDLTLLYDSESMNAITAAPEGSSKLCLSCHDGTMAIGRVGVLNGQVDVDITMVSTNIDGSGTTTGYTRNLGTSLTNDHPISFTYDTALAGVDGELLDPGTASHIGTGTPRHPIPLELGADGEAKLQCTACHDPHIRDADLAVNAKFLRLNRFQEVAATGAAFNATNDQVCLGCHDKAGWEGSAHAHSTVADETYTTAAATQRDFDAALPVWKAGCLNCHDTHTVQGARRLLREGTDSTANPKTGGNPALEETCYQCHDGSTAVITPATSVPNIKSDFALARRMPITSADQPAATEVHAITDKDFSEAPLNLGKGDLNNRHAECTDCHNPHRVIKNRLFNANPTTADAAGTHPHTSADITTYAAAGETWHTNIASGVLTGTTGVEPVYGADTWGTAPTGYDVKKGYGGVNASTAVTSTWVTREYQVCLKCHSDNAWTTAPTLGSFVGGTPSGTNGLTAYTDQAMEFRAPATHQGDPAAIAGFGKHRSWHPVMNSTGRTATVRGMNANNFLAPWNDATGTNIGNQTMYCSDCHGSNVTSLTNVVPDGGENGNPWGPHGSSNDFVLKGTWNDATGAAGGTDTGICFKCHDWNHYANPAPPVWQLSGFRQAVTAAGCALTNPTINLHSGHAARIGRMECTWCHVAVPHGWKNKALLIDISVAAPDGCAAVENCYAPPYIQGGYLGGSGAAVVWRASGGWAAADCGGQAWMNGMAPGGACNAPL
jgi:hypothetical protein